MKKAITFITVLCLIMTSFSGTVFAQSKISSKPPLSMQILGKKTVDAPVIKDEVVYLPFRAVGEGLGYKVKWYSASKTMELTKDKNILKATVDYEYAYVDSKKVELDNTPIMHLGRVYVPLSFIEKNVNYKIVFDTEKNMVVISEKDSTNKSSETAKNESKDSNIVYVNKIKLDSKAPIEKNNKTFVPARAVSEALGYTVTWFSASSTMKLTKADSVIVLTMKSTYAKVNDVKTKLDAAPFLENDSAYISIGFVQDILGCTVSIDKQKNVIAINDKSIKLEEAQTGTVNVEDIVYEEGGGFPQLKIVADKPIEYTSFTLKNPERFVIDIQNAVMKTSFSEKSINKGGITKVRIAQNSVEPQKVVRVVIDLSNPQECKLAQAEDKKSISLIYANIIKPIEVGKDGDRDVITLAGTSVLDTSITKLTNPDRLVIDINRAVHDKNEQTINVESALVKTVRTGQFDVGTARVVLDLNANVFYRLKNEGNVTKVYISETPFEFFQYKKYYNSAYIDVSPGYEVEYQASIDKAKNILTISIPMDLDVDLTKYEINDNIIEYIEVKKQTFNKKVYTIAECKMKSLVNYELLSPALTKLVKVKFKYNAEKFEQLTIVIDAGHGGKDPGAIASDGTMEKTMNLDVAARLNEKLKAIGFKTIMTRTDDTYYDLASRVDLANNNFADFFMSIHFNSFNSTTKGIETLYFPNTVNEESTIDNKSIAEIFHKEVTKALDMPSRGITPRPNLYVLNKTKMPAILAELGFLSNPDELAKIKTEEYREMSAKALAASIVKYFKEIQKLDLEFDVQSIYTDSVVKTITSNEIVKENK